MGGERVTLSVRISFTINDLVRFRRDSVSVFSRGSFTGYLPSLRLSETREEEIGDRGPSGESRVKVLYTQGKEESHSYLFCLGIGPYEKYSSPHRSRRTPSLFRDTYCLVTVPGNFLLLSSVLLPLLVSRGFVVYVSWSLYSQKPNRGSPISLTDQVSLLFY